MQVVTRFTNGTKHLTIDMGITLIILLQLARFGRY